MIFPFGDCELDEDRRELRRRGRRVEIHACGRLSDMAAKSLGPRKQRGRARRPLIVDAETSARLGRVRQRDTSPELAVRRALRQLGIFHRVSNRDLPGVTRCRQQSEALGDVRPWMLWHRHAHCVRATTPKRNRAFWNAKFAANQARDERAVTAPQASAFRVIVIWECDTTSPAQLTKRLRRELGVPKE